MLSAAGRVCAAINKPINSRHSLFVNTLFKSGISLTAQWSGEREKERETVTVVRRAREWFKRGSGDSKTANERSEVFWLSHSGKERSWSAFEFCEKTPNIWKECIITIDTFILEVYELFSDIFLFLTLVMYFPKSLSLSLSLSPAPTHQ